MVEEKLTEGDLIEFIDVDYYLYLAVLDNPKGISIRKILGNNEDNILGCYISETNKEELRPFGHHLTIGFAKIPNYHKIMLLNKIYFAHIASFKKYERNTFKP